MKNAFSKYASSFSEFGLWRKIHSAGRQAGIKTVYSALLLFYAFRRKETPAWAKNIILGILGYFLAPLDAIPDISPIIGYTDDIGVLGFGLVTIAAYINEDVKVKARVRLKKWFGKVELAELSDVDSRL